MDDKLKDSFAIEKEIVEITELNNPNRWIGVKIVLKGDKELVFKISNGQSCCEVYGYYMMENNKEVNKLSNHIGSTVKNVEYCISDDKEDDYKYNCKITVYTDKGDFMIILYNEHNGYYPHDISLQILDKCILDSL